MNSNTAKTVITGVAMTAAMLGTPVMPAGATATTEAQARNAQAQIARELRNGPRRPGDTSGK